MKENHMGPLFIIGDSNEVLRRSHPLVLNPFEGQPKESCSIRKTRVLGDREKFCSDRRDLCYYGKRHNTRSGQVS